MTMEAAGLTPRSNQKPGLWLTKLDKLRPCLQTQRGRLSPQPALGDRDTSGATNKASRQALIQDRPEQCGK